MKGITYRTLDVPTLGALELAWPEGDAHLWKWANQVVHADAAISLCEQRRVCVQAGGACGVWPMYLSRYFDLVITFEPFAENFAALLENCRGMDNIMAVNAALSDRPGFGSVAWKAGAEKNYGAQYVGTGADFLCLTLDSLALDSLDLLILDLEGAEGKAFRGGSETIARHRPVVMYEECGHVKQFGETAETVAASLPGYRRVSKTRDDVVLVPA